MPTDFNGREPDSPTDAEGSMFGATPIWERQRTKRGVFGRKSAPKAAQPRATEPRTFAPEPESHLADSPADEMILTTPATLASSDPVGPGLGDPRPLTVESAMDEPIAAPIQRPVRTTTRKSAGISSTALFGGAAVFALIGIGGWFLLQPRDGVPVLAPGQPTEVAATPLTPLASDVDIATNTLPERAAATPAPTATQAAAPAPIRTARARPAPARAAAPSAAASGANASTVIPDGPQPYSTLNPSAAPTQVTPAAPPPVEAAPPAAIPSTPPVQAPAPTETPPETPPQ